MQLFFILLAVLILVTLLSIWFYRRVNSSNHFFQLDRSIEERLDWVKGAVKPGDIGTATSRLAPVGKAMINSHEFEVTSISDYIERGTSVKIIEVSGNRITVKAN